MYEIFSQPNFKANASAAIEAMGNKLATGGCISIFPEGTSHNSTEILKLKTGFARAAFTAIKKRENDKNFCVHIVPVGLNYNAKNRFRSDVFINFGEAIKVDHKWLDERDGDFWKAVEDLTKLLKERIEELTITAPNDRVLKIAHLSSLLFLEENQSIDASYVATCKKFVKLFSKSPSEEAVKLFKDLSVYQSKLDLIGLK
jgi:glycerol-3-phosphate O-acyltransferase/dihydroxyacetone phosphate acyltransferase